MAEFKRHENWSSRLTFLMAAVGAAVGLGNIWRFPFITGANGGSAFVLVYLLVIVLVALPILIAEIALGRMGQQSPPHALAIVASKQGRSARWSVVGWLGLLAAYLIATYYSVIAGWTISYMFKSGAGTFGGQDAKFVAEEFARLQADPWQLILWHGVFLFITAAILMRGLKNGIEKSAMILMPLLFLLLLTLVIYSAIEGDMAAGLDFLFAFDMSAITGKVVLMAIGHAFFSIGVAMGLMLGFGAYLEKDVSIGSSALIIVGADTLVALVAGIAIFPIVFAHGLDPSEGPGLVFVSLPIAFGHMPGGLVFGTLFFLLLFFAALTSAIGVLEPLIAWLEESTRLGRKLATALLSGSIFVLGLGTVFSFNIWANWQPLGFIERFSGMSFFATLDYITANLMMPLGGFLLAVLAGWLLPVAAMREGLNFRRPWVFTSWLWLIRFVAPLSILAIFLANL